MHFLKGVKSKHKLKNYKRGNNTGTPFCVQNLCFQTNWDENVWTERLVKGIEETFPDLKATFSAKLCFSKDILRLCAGFIPNHV